MHANGLKYLDPYWLSQGSAHPPQTKVKPAISRDSLLEDDESTNKPALVSWHQGRRRWASRLVHRPLFQSTPRNFVKTVQAAHGVRQRTSNGSGPLQNHHTAFLVSCPTIPSLSERDRWRSCLPKSGNRIRRSPGFRSHFHRPLSPSEASADNGRKLYVKNTTTVRDCHGDNGEETGGVNHRSLYAMRTTSPSDHESHRTVVMEKTGLPQDLFRTLMTGLDGTPMPSYAKSNLPGRRRNCGFGQYLQSYLTLRRDNFHGA